MICPTYFAAQHLEPGLSHRDLVARLTGPGQSDCDVLTPANAYVLELVCELHNSVLCLLDELAPRQNDGQVPDFRFALERLGAIEFCLEAFRQRFGIPWSEPRFRKWAHPCPAFVPAACALGLVRGMRDEVKTALAEGLTWPVGFFDKTLTNIEFELQRVRVALGVTRGQSIEVSIAGLYADNAFSRLCALAEIGIAAFPSLTASASSQSPSLFVPVLDSAT